MTPHPKTHSPTPWSISDDGYTTGYIGIASENTRTALAVGQPNAAFIVQACNAYDSDQEKIKALVEVLKNLLMEHKSVMLSEFETRNNTAPYLTDIYKKCQEVIRLVEEKP